MYKRQLACTCTSIYRDANVHGVTCPLFKQRAAEATAQTEAMRAPLPVRLTEEEMEALAWAEVGFIDDLRGVALVKRGLLEHVRGLDGQIIENRYTRTDLGDHALNANRIGKGKQA